MSTARADWRVAVVGALLTGLLPLAGCSRDAAVEQTGVAQQQEPAAEVGGDDPSPPPSSGARPAEPPSRGLVRHEPRAGEGYVLFSPLVSDTTYLIDRQGREVHTWKTSYAPGSALYLLPNGHLLRNGRDPDLENFRAGGTGGIFQELDWEGNVVWEWSLSTEERVQHHDIEPLPNGNILALGWEVKSPEECARAGRRPDLIPEAGLWPDFVVEIQPLPPDDARIVWEWHAWDHMVQDRDPGLAHYGDPADHPGRFDINGLGEAPEMDAEQLEQLKALGYVPDDAEATDLESDFLHVNAVAYNPTLDQIALSVPEAGEVWIIDHSTTTEEAAGSTGGRSGRGGDLLYRWGNPQLYGRGDESAKQLFYQHNVHWIPEGMMGAGNLLVFNNGGGRADGDWSSVVELAPPVETDGRYRRETEASWGPHEPVWTYAHRETFFAPFISGAHRLPNGHTMICSGPNGRFFEVDSAGEVVWEYWNPYEGDIRLEDGNLPQPGLDRYPYAVFQVASVPADHPALSRRTLVADDRHGPEEPLDAVDFGP